MSRVDISNYLVHLTKGEDAFSNFSAIAREAELLGGTGYIKGTHRCVCFSEAPLHALQGILEHPSDHDFKYAPFGVIIEKKWLFERGGRPVIYQRDEEYARLPPELQWRHVIYEPNWPKPVDHTWEREWRIKTDSLAISPENAILLVQTVDDLRAICEEHSLADFIPLDLYERLEDTTPLSALINGRHWTVILVRDPPNGWSGLDVDLD